MRQNSELGEEEKEILIKKEEKNNIKMKEGYMMWTKISLHRHCFTVIYNAIRGSLSSRNKCRP